jgi:hypothetical protein
MKKILSLFLLFYTLYGYTQNISIDLKSENLKGKVKSYTKKTQVKSKEDDSFVLKYHEKHVFNKDGSLKSIENYGNDQKLDSKEIFEYESQNLVQITQYNATSSIGKTTLFDYNENGKLVSKKKFNSQGKLQYEISYVYNKKNQLTTQQKLIPSINYSMKEDYKYDSKGNMIERIKKVRIGNTKELFEYNHKNLPIKKSEYNSLGELYSVISYKYNNQDDKVSLEKRDNTGELTYYESYSYQYDHKKNWTEKISYEKDVKVSVEKRIIEYY